MNTNTDGCTPAVASRQPVTHLNPPPATARVLKLALDVHLQEQVVAMQCDGRAPKPPPRFKPKDFPAWVEKQIALGWQVISCYEAGPFGYGRHRQLTELGVTHHVIRPRNWDAEHKRVKTDRTDALARLTAPALVRVPTPEQERARTESRLRQSLRKDLQRQNRRQVSNYPGLCPGEHSSGACQQCGRITKTGNPRLRWALCEAAWRLVRCQPDYRLCQKWRAPILHPKLGAGRRKQLSVARARGFGVDWWRLCTGQTTAEKLGLKMADQNGFHSRTLDCFHKSCSVSGM